ncbi:MAG: type II/IV secretion system protein, partial [Pseudanabaena sp.]
MNESRHSEGESVWKRLRHGNIATCEEALNFLVDIEGNVHLSWLDQDLTHRFFREFEDRSILPPVIPLLLW